MSKLPNGSAGDGSASLARLPYERPHLARVRLEADQVLSGGCKLNSSGPNSGSAVSCAYPTGPCNKTLGS